MAYWLTCEDAVRIRMALWPKGDKGTVLLFPGRTEYIEKYARAAQDLATRGYACAVIDWRGQGLADRPKPDPRVGDVADFSDYQKDLHAVLAKVDDLRQPGPFYLIGHSMGGCIGLRALQNGLNVKAAAFSAPMWGIKMAPGVLAAARVLAGTATAMGQALRYVPGASEECYAQTAPFAGNVLTSDPETFAWIKNQLTTHPELALGGPGMRWLHQALAECRALMAMPAPDVPCYCALGTAEKVVDPAPIHKLMARWSNGSLDLVEDAEHEVMMEIAPTRKRFFDSATALFDASR
jgi:lysophospholipase